MPTIRLPERLAPRLGLAALAGAAGVACFAPFGLFWLAPPVWAAFFLLLRRAANRRQGLLTGLCFGLGFFLGGVSWVYVSLAVFGGMPWWLAGPATLLFCAVLALYPAVGGWAFKAWQPPGLVRQALFFAALVGLADWLRSWLFTGFPWLSLGYSQAPPSPLAGYAPLIGVFGLSFLVALCGAFLARWRIGVPLLAAVALAGFGLRQIAWTEADGPPVSVALVQGNIAQETKFEPEAYIHTLTLYRDLIATHPAQLTLLPETALPAFIDQVPAEYLDELKELAQRNGGDIIAGVLTGNISAAYFNSAISLGASPLQIYSKQHLVPYGEFIPPGFAWFMAFANIPASSFSRGPHGQPPLAVAGRQVAVDICYEDAFGSEIAAALPAAGILANISNTAWFGRSLAQPQHLQIAQLRALETGRPMLRATNTGMTAIVAPDGEIASALPPFTTGVLTGQVQARRGTTPYAQAGDWPALIVIAAALLGALWRRRPGNRAKP